MLGSRTIISVCLQMVPSAVDALVRRAAIQMDLLDSLKSLCHLHEVQQDLVKGSTSWEIHNISTHWVMSWLRAALQRKIWGYCGWKIIYEQAICACSLEIQPCPGLHQNKNDHCTEEGDSSPLLHSPETSPGILHQALEIPAQKRHGPIRAISEDSWRNDEKIETPLLWRETEKVGIV